MSQQKPPTVHLLLSSSTTGYGNDADDTLNSYAHLVCRILKERFDVSNVSVRSACAPPDALLSIGAGNDDGGSDDDGSSPVLFVVLGPPTSSTSVLETEGRYPIISLSPASQNPEGTALAVAKCCSLACPRIRLRVRQSVFENRQSRLVADAELRTKSPRYVDAIAACHDEASVVTGDGVPVEGRLCGKVRDRYVGNHKLALLTTDRQSGFDRQLALIPYKGAVLNLTSAYWFERTRSIIANHLISVPHPNVSIVKKCKPFPIEFVVRSYMTGSTSTSIWKNYSNGVRNYCGHDLPEGMTKNQKLDENILTPTTKEEEHDRPISAADIVKENWMTQSDLDVCAEAALKVFAYGQKVAFDRGLILVDTKYEFGRDEETGEIMLIDEVHTPDSSRYWLASTYTRRMAEGKEPDNIDKEFLRLWFADKCDPYNCKDESLPEAPRDLVVELSRRYVTLYEMITWNQFDFDTCAAAVSNGNDAIADAIKSNI